MASRGSSSGQGLGLVVQCFGSDGRGRTRVRESNLGSGGRHRPSRSGASGSRGPRPQNDGLRTYWRPPPIAGRRLEERSHDDNVTELAPIVPSVVDRLNLCIVLEQATLSRSPRCSTSAPLARPARRPQCRPACWLRRAVGDQVARRPSPRRSGHPPSAWRHRL